MEGILIMHYGEGRLPKLSPEQISGLKAVLAVEIAKHPGVAHKGTYVSDDGTGICVWEGSITAVKSILKAAGLDIPDKDIVEVKKIM